MIPWSLGWMCTVKFGSKFLTWIFINTSGITWPEKLSWKRRIFRPSYHSLESQSNSHSWYNEAVIQAFALFWYINPSSDPDLFWKAQGLYAFPIIKGVSFCELSAFAVKRYVRWFFLPLKPECDLSESPQLGDILFRLFEIFKLKWKQNNIHIEQWGLISIEYIS